MTLVVAQPDHSKIKDLKVAYFTEKLQLTPSETDKFWKIYNQYEAERQSLKKSSKKPEGQKISEMSDVQIDQLINSTLDKKEKEAALQKKYFVEFKKVLPPQKVVKLLYIEEQFRQFLFKKAQQKRK
jgi:hypothetical protein